MKTKEELIKEAWGLLWDNFNKTAKECALKNNGYVSAILENNLHQTYTYYNTVKEAWRPISLEGIENNNGWVKIESEEDLPNKNDVYCCMVLGTKTVLEYFDNSKVKGFIFPGSTFINKYNEIGVTHYKPIFMGKDPLY